MSRHIVLVSGAPGTGKTAVAVPLAHELKFPLLSRDDIKETLWDSIELPCEAQARSAVFSKASMDLLWVLALRCPVAVLDAPFRPRSAAERTKLEGFGARLIEVHCHCPPALAIQRYNKRAPYRHPAHVLKTMTPDYLMQFEGPLNIGPLIEVDTELPVDYGLLVRCVRGLLRQDE